MPVRTVWEVRQRTWDHSGSRSLGIFVDDMMADNAIRSCYWQLWQDSFKDDVQPSLWVPTRESFGAETWDQWFPDDLNSDHPLFYKVQHRLWDQLPSSIQNFTFVLEDGLSPMVRVQI